MHALVARDHSSVVASRCVLHDCSAAAVVLCQHAHVSLKGCRVLRCAAAALAGQGGGGGLLELRDGCVVEASAKMLWVDHDRPRSLLYSDDFLDDEENAWLAGTAEGRGVSESVGVLQVRREASRRTEEDVDDEEIDYVVEYTEFYDGSEL